MISRSLSRAEKAAVKRADDNPETISARIDTYIENAEEILSQYPGKTVRVSQSPNELESQIDQQNNDKNKIWESGSIFLVVFDA